MNDTKWNELRLAMYELGDLSPKWRTKSIDTSYISQWDGEWFYHFSVGGYRDIDWVEIQTITPEHHAAVLSALKQIHVPGQECEHGFKVYGYATENQSLSYL